MRLPIIAALLLTVPLASAQVTKSGAGYLFRMKFAKGKTVRFLANSTIKMTSPDQKQPTNMMASLPMVQSVTDVKNGVATISAKLGPYSLNGQPITQQPMVTTVKIDNLGKVVGGNAGMGSTYTTYPKTPIRVGGTWTSAVALGSLTGPGQGSNANATYKFLGLKNVGGKQVANVAITLKTTGQRAVTGSGTGLISVTDGMPLKVNLNATMVNPQGGAPVRFTIDLTRR